MVEQRMLVVMGATMAFVGGIRAINAYLPIYLENRGHNLDAIYWLSPSPKKKKSSNSMYYWNIFILHLEENKIPQKVIVLCWETWAIIYCIAAEKGECFPGLEEK